MPRQFGTLTKDTATIQDYDGWLKTAGAEPGCKGSDNPAFWDSTSPKHLLDAAQAQCARCPLQQGCLFFARTQVFAGFDGVMGGRVIRKGMKRQEREDREERLAS